MVQIGCVVGVCRSQGKGRMLGAHSVDSRDDSRVVMLFCPLLID